MTRSRRTRPVGSTGGLTTHCSFCGRPHAEAARVVAGPGVYICDACVDLCNQIIATSPPSREGDAKPVHRGPDPRTDEYLSGMSDEDMLAMLPRQALTVEQAERDLRAWVRLLRDRGVTWARIGEALGVSRQAAWDRFAADIATGAATDTPADPDIATDIPAGADAPAN
ncbi:ClpX C4-type zinc finger protein [Nonomuraea antri]|uniref:ClpX C4-type zinc finger protein n=1 Tax=Nonomuraea antri TaxID=2730852 RepID=UPI0038B23A76